MIQNIQIHVINIFCFENSVCQKFSACMLSCSPCKTLHAYFVLDRFRLYEVNRLCMEQFT